MAGSAQKFIKSWLARYGLQGLATWAWRKYRSGESMEEILAEMRLTTLYKQRFPAMEELGKRGLAISEEAYIAYEQGVRNLTQQFGLPQNIYGSRSYIAELLTNDVALTEVQQRAQLAMAASTTSPPQYRREAARMYGITPGQWTSMWLEPDRTLPELEKQFAAAQIAGEVTMASMGELSRTQAERLVEAGITREQAREGLANTSQDLSRRLPGERDRLTEGQQVFGALGVGRDRQKYEERIQRRLSDFAGGGGALTTERGAGLGSTSR